MMSTGITFGRSACIRKPNAGGAERRRLVVDVGQSEPGYRSTTARRRGVDRRIFALGLVASVGAHVAALVFAALPVTPHRQIAGRAPLQAIEAPVLYAVQLPEPERRPPPMAETAPPASAIPVPTLEAAPATLAELPVVATPVQGPPPAVRGDSAVSEPRQRALAGSLLHGQYEQEVARWVERQRDYPLSARRRGIQGTAIVRLRLAADGSLIQVQIVRDTGHAVLDRAAIGMVERAAPFPGVPTEIGGSSVDVLVPIQFSLGT